MCIYIYIFTPISNGDEKHEMSLDSEGRKKSFRENCLMLREREQYYLSLEMSRNNLTRTGNVPFYSQNDLPGPQRCSF